MVTNPTAVLPILLPFTFVFAGAVLFLLFRHSAYKRSMNSLLQGCLDGVLVVDMQRSVLFYNDAFAALWKPPADLLASRDDRRLLAHATAQLVDPDAYVAGVENAFISEEARWNDLAVLKDGRIFERRSQPFWRDGIIKGRLFSFRDVTERCRTEEALRADARRHETFGQMALLASDKTNVQVLFEALKGDICNAVRADKANLSEERLAASFQGACLEPSTTKSKHATWMSREFAGQHLIVARDASLPFSPGESSFLTNTAQLLERCAARGRNKMERRATETTPSAAQLGGAKAPQSNQSESAREDRSKLQLLVVEDNPINQKVLVQMLKRADHLVDVACDGAEAVDMAARTTYDLILMDCQMPRMDGFDATRAIRAEGLNQKTNIVAVTANAFPEDRTRCLDAGMNDHVPKPLTKARLDETLSRWLGDQAQSVEY